MVDGKNIGLLRWVGKYHPNNVNIIKEAIVKLSSEMLKIGFFLNDNTFEGVKTQINSVNFERSSSGNVDYILVIFDRHDPMKFQVAFGLKRGSDPFEWIRAGNLVKRKSDAISAKWWGAGWFSLSKEQSFKKDWMKFLTSISDIENFLAGEGERGFVRASTIGG
jgi:hypothetical protein